ncbi:hypothetical protein J4Q44_G00210940 [Coregonus suidteri]|uniref:C2H2-type domain-containing protein n=1 Tax=Coregonus suidteri TaxID=861788 RepID=A0AAN8LD31_9TELE
MYQLQLLRVFLNERLTAAAVEIFGAVEKTLVEYQEENDRLRRLLWITPGIKQCRIVLQLLSASNLELVLLDVFLDSLQLSLAVSGEEVPPEQQHCEQEWSPSLGQEDPELTQIKEEQEEVWTSQEEEQLQGLEADSIEFKFTPSCVKSECDQEDPLWSLPLPQIQTVENRESDSKVVDLKPFGTVTQLKSIAIPCDPPDNDNNASSHSSAISSDPVGLDSNPQLDPNPPLDSSPPLDPHLTLEKTFFQKPSTTSRKTQRCHDCGETFAPKADLLRHVTLNKERPSECCFCKTSKLKAHKPCTCPVCGKTLKYKGDLSRHMRIHTGDKYFSCGDCGKSFSLKGNLMKHKLTHTGAKPFSCGDCGKSFNRKENLTMHIRTHTGEKPFSCGDCGKSFSLKGNLMKHKLTHTGAKPFSCGDCGKSFTVKGNLTMHKLTHTGEKPFSCGDCGKSFNRKKTLTMHTYSHRGESI